MIFAQRRVNDTPLIHFLKQFAFNFRNIPDGNPRPIHQYNYALIFVNFFDGTGGGNIAAAGLLLICPEIGYRYYGMIGGYLRKRRQLISQGRLRILAEFPPPVSQPRCFSDSGAMPGECGLS